jgi:hypothetical protein
MNSPNHSFLEEALLWLAVIVERHPESKKEIDSVKKCIINIAILQSGHDEFQLIKP